MNLTPPLMSSRRTLLRVRAHAPSSDEPRQPFRWWTTGSVAVVMAALLPLRDMSPNAREAGLRVLRHSRFGAAETALRIERAADHHGLYVIAKLRGDRPLIALASAGGITPVLMETADSEPTLLLGLMVRPAGDGSDVVARALSTPEWAAAMSPDELASLPRLLQEALG